MTGFTVYGYKVGSGLFIVLFSFVTVATALIRKLCLKRGLQQRQWIAIFVITVGIIISSVDEFKDELGTFDLGFFFAIVCALAAAMCDAVMYCFAEHTLSMDDSPTANELSGIVGAINLVLTAIYGDTSAVHRTV